MDSHSIRKLESDLWESADLLRAESKLTSNQYCMPVLGLIFLLNKFAKNIAQDDGVFFTPKSLVKMIVNVLEPKGGVLLENCIPSLMQIAAA